MFSHRKLQSSVHLSTWLWIQRVGVPPSHTRVYVSGKSDGSRIQIVAMNIHYVDTVASSVAGRRFHQTQRHRREIYLRQNVQR